MAQELNSRVLRGLARIEIKHVPRYEPAIFTFAPRLLCYLFPPSIELINMSVYDVKGKNAIVTGAGSGMPYLLIACIQNGQLTSSNRYLPCIRQAAS